MYIQGNWLLLYLVLWSTLLLIPHGFNLRFGLFCILETCKDGDSTTSLGNLVHCWAFLMGVFSAHSSSLYSCFLMADLPSGVLTVPSFWCDLQMGKVCVPSPLPCHRWRGYTGQVSGPSTWDFLEKTKAKELLSSSASPVSAVTKSPTSFTSRPTLALFCLLLLTAVGCVWLGLCMNFFFFFPLTHSWHQRLVEAVQSFDPICSAHIKQSWTPINAQTFGCDAGSHTKNLVCKKHCLVVL